MVAVGLGSLVNEKLEKMGEEVAREHRELNP